MCTENMAALKMSLKGLSKEAMLWIAGGLQSHERYS